MWFWNVNMDESLPQIIIDNKNKAHNEVNKNVILECEYG
jgi:hypothetical protein